MSDDDYEGRPQELEEWLETNVLVIPEPLAVSLYCFDVNWSDWSGTFKLKFDDFELEDPVGLGIGIDGRTKFYLPAFTSPLGVPATFSAIRLTGKTELAVIEGLNRTFPRLKPLGRSRETGLEIVYSTPIIARLSEWQIASTKRLIVSEYSISVNLNEV